MSPPQVNPRVHRVHRAHRTVRPLFAVCRQAGRVLWSVLALGAVLVAVAVWLGLERPADAPGTAGEPGPEPKGASAIDPSIESAPDAAAPVADGEAEGPPEPRSLTPDRPETNEPKREKAARTLPAAEPRPAQAPRQPERTAAVPEAPKVPKAPKVPEAAAVPEVSQVASSAASPAPRPFMESCFAPFAVPYPDEKELRRWLLPAQKVGHRMKTTRENNRHCVEIHGVLRLRVPWTPKTVLRFSVFRTQRFKVHLWRAGRGITLRFYEKLSTWAAYATRRRTDQPRPSSHSLLATDGGRYRRTGSGTVELRHQDGHLVLSRGTVVLLRLAFPNLPTEVLLDGQARVAGIESYPGDPMPLPTRQPRRLALDGRQPAALEWQQHGAVALTRNVLAGGGETSARPSRGPGRVVGGPGRVVGGPGRVVGGLEVLAGKTEAAAGWRTKLPALSAYDLVFRIENASPDTGVMLANRDGVPTVQIAFYRAQRGAGEAVFALERAKARRQNSRVDADKSPVPLAGVHHWLRLTVGPNLIACWTSGDGELWSRVGQAIVETGGLPEWVGLYIEPGQKDRRIQLRELLVRPALETDLVLPAELRDALEGGRGAVNSHAWDHLVEAVIPPDGVRGTLVSRLRFLHQLAELVPTGKGGAEYVRKLESAYVRIGERLADEGRRPYSSLIGALLTVPVEDPDFDVRPHGLVRRELLELAYARQWEELSLLCRELWFWTLSNRLQPPSSTERRGDSVMSLIRWADRVSAAGLRRPPRREPIGRSHPLPIVHPLSQDVGREAYNLHADFHAALRSESFREAGKLLQSADEEAYADLIPDAEDPQLLMRFGQVAERGLDRYPAFRKTMEDTFGGVAALRVRRAIRNADARALVRVTRRFPGTHAAARAHRWLGDRELSAGRFQSAEKAYRRALRTALPEDRKVLEARLRFGAAMRGHLAGSPQTDVVEFAGTTLAAAKFEELVTEMVARRRDSAIGDNEAAVTVESRLRRPAPLLPIRPDAKVSLRGSVDVVRHRGLRRSKGIRGSGDVLAVAPARDLIVVSDQVRLTALQLSTGKQLWSLGRPVPPARKRLPALSLRPTIAAGRVYANLVEAPRLRVVCLDIENGHEVWRYERSTESIVADPFVIDSRVLVLTMRSSPSGGPRLDAILLDGARGHELRRWPLATFREPGKQSQAEPPYFRVGGSGDRFVVSGVGTVIGCEIGATLWIRRQLLVSAEYDTLVGEQFHAVPAVDEEHVYIVQPGVRAVECLKLRSGERVWQTVMPRLIQWLGQTEDRCFIRTASGVTALDKRSGRVIWSRPSELLLRGHLLGGDEILLAERERGRSGQPDSKVTLVWVSTKAGTERGRLRIDEVSDRQVNCSVLWSQEKSVYALLSGQPKDPARVVELR